MIVKRAESATYIRLGTKNVFIMWYHTWSTDALVWRIMWLRNQLEWRRR